MEVFIGDISAVDDNHGCQTQTKQTSLMATMDCIHGCRVEPVVILGWAE